MKQINILAALLFLILMGSCSHDLLNTELLDKQTESNFYKTETDAKLALIGCYDGLQRVWEGGISFPVASEILSDNCYGGTGASDGFGYQMLDEFNKDRSPSDKNLFENNWIAYYRAIYRCNMLLSKMEQITWKTDGLKEQIEAETRFIRAFCYFDMTRLFEKVPLLEVPSVENIPQANADDIYKLIANDLKFAAEKGIAKKYADIAVADRGHATKWAAGALLARVYLFYTGYYAKSDLVGVVTKAQALAFLEDAIANSGHALVADFEKLWPAAAPKDYAGEDNIETVFAIKYTFTSDYNGNVDGNQWMVMNGMREFSSYPYGKGWGACTVNPKLWEAYNENDARKSASVISIVDEAIKYTKIEGQREYTGYYNKKYTPTCDENGNSIAEQNGAANFMIGQFQDYVAIRYSDILLMAAELGSTKAQEYFNLVRKRAYKLNFVEIPPTQNAIMAERRLEFAFEGLRYWDLLRLGLTTTASAINQTLEVKSGGLKETKTITFNAATKGFQQIPYNQITLSNGILKQNAGW
jgi:starch-binding outer membrane protein, SusD/RagB family